MFSDTAHDASLAALFTLVTRRSELIGQNRRITAIIRTTGYCLAATGPMVMGWVHEHDDDWVAPSTMVVEVLVLMTVCTQIVTRADDSDRPMPTISADVLSGGDEQAERDGDR